MSQESGRAGLTPALFTATIVTMKTEEASVRIADLIEKKNRFQEEVGAIVLDVRETYGSHQTESLRELIKEQGITVSASSLRQYAWVVESSRELGLPADLDFSTKRNIISSPHKDKYIGLIDQGYNHAQLKMEIAKDNKVAKTKCTGYCKYCSKEVDVKNHDCQTHKD